MKTKDFERILVDEGFALVRQGAHRVWKKENRHLAVPNGRVINRMVARRLLKEIGYAGKVSELNYG